MSDFPLPKGAQLLASGPTPLPIKGEGARCVIRPSAESQRLLVTILPMASGQPARGQVFLLLENIRGSRDATVLNVYVQLPGHDNPAQPAQWQAGSVGLFGLRMASIRHAESAGNGLTFLFDITPLLLGQLAGRQLPIAEIQVSIRPNHPLPDSSDLVVECVSIYRVPA
ncbi:hypothetical protein GCM10022409_20590 [Hymenobacter glaciei]|uniref:DUF7868 domain-containing protein n=1 Tax=Hymenobacter glaciei TaxID=877209 RepID=A0ABP7U484_9BACT